MKKRTWILLTAMFLLTWTGMTLTASYAAGLQDSFTTYRQKALRETLRLRVRMTEMEEELKANAETAPDENMVPADAPTETMPVGQGSDPAGATCTDEVTHPGAHAAEEPAPTQPAEACAYHITEYQGIIGVFDGGGHLVQTVNVRVDTLPAVDREELAVGISARTWQEMMDIVGAYA